jgi:hypothetical protein
VNPGTRLALKVIGCGAAAIVLVPLAAFAWYDLTRYQPHSGEIEQIVASAHPSERSPPAMLRTLHLTDWQGDLSWSTSRLLIFKLETLAARHRNLAWQRTWFLWRHLVKLHLSEDEQLAIICSTTFLGRGAYGFEAGARTFFQRPLNQLTDAELATLVVRASAPSHWLRPDSAEDLAKAASGLLARVREKENPAENLPGR